MKHRWLVDGVQATGVPLDDRGLAYGDGLFETIAVIGGRPRLWQAHMDRLAEGCERLGIDMPPQEILLRDVQAATREHPHSVVKLIVTRGSATRGYHCPPQGRVRRIIGVSGFPPAIEGAVRDGVSARVLDLRLAHQAALGGIKHLNRLEQVLAALELDKNGHQEGVLLDQDAFVISTVAANLFLVCGDTLITPRMDRCGVRGVVRAQILLANKSRSELRRVSMAMLAEADEVFACNAIRGIVPVIRVDDLAWPVGPVTRELQDWFRRRARAA